MSNHIKPEEKLNPCPYCKALPKFVEEGSQKGVKCNCGFGIFWICENAKEKAIQDWNSQSNTEKPKEK